MMNNEIIEQLRDCVTGRSRPVDGNALVAWFGERGVNKDAYRNIRDFASTLVIADALIAANAALPWSIATSATNAVATTAARAAQHTTATAQAALDVAEAAYDQAHRAAAAAQTMAQAVTYRAAKDVDRALRVVALLAEINRADEEGR